MAEVLSQDQIDQLLSAISAGEISPEEIHQPRDRRRIKIYDFKRPDKFSRDQIRTISIIHETFARLATTCVAAHLRSLVHVHVASVDALTYEEFIRAIPNPTTLAIIDMAPLTGSAILEIDPGITFSMVDRLLGGPGEGAGYSRDLTSIELAVMEDVLVRMLGALRESWSTVIDLRPRLGGIVTNPQFAGIVPPSEMVVLVTLESKVGEVEGMMNLCIPYLTIEPITSKLSAQYWYSSVRRGSQTLRPRVGDLEVEAKVYVPTEALTLRALGELKRGSRIRLPGLDNGEACLAAGERPLIRLKATRLGPRGQWEFAVAILDPWPLAHLDLLPPAEQAASDIAEKAKGLERRVSSLERHIQALTRTVHRATDAPPSRGGAAVEPRESSAAEERAEDQRSCGPAGPFGFLCAGDIEFLHGLFLHELPQTSAMILSYLDPAMGAHLLSRLEEETRNHLITRVATMAAVAPEVLERVHDVILMMARLARAGQLPRHEPLEVAAGILNRVGQKVREEVIGSIQESNPRLAESITIHMFQFEDLQTLEPEIMQTVLKFVEQRDLAVALEHTEEPIRQRILSLMGPSERECICTEAKDTKGTASSEAEQAKLRIARIVRGLWTSKAIIVDPRPE